MDRNAQPFVAAWKSIRDSVLSEASGQGVRDTAFPDILFSVANRNPVVRENLKDIDAFVKLGEAIECGDNREPLAEIPACTARRADAVAKMLKSPPPVIPTFERPVMHVESGFAISDVLDDMLKLSFSQVPVLSKDGTIRDLLTTDTISRWLAGCMSDEKKLQKLSSAKVEQVLACAEELPEGSRRFDVLGPRSNCLTVLRLFEQAANTGVRLDAIIVTRDGTAKGGIAGIITGWDLPQVVGLTSVSRALQDDGKREAKANSFHSEGATYRIRFDGAEWTVKDTAGARYLRELLCNPGRPFRSTELIHRLAGENRVQAVQRPDDGTEWPGPRSIDDPSIRETVANYRKALKEIEKDIGRLQCQGADENRDAISRLQEDQERVREELVRLVNKDGKPRKARSSEDKGDAIRRAVDRCLGKAQDKKTDSAVQALKAHVKRHTRFGVVCQYGPPPGFEWE